MDMALAAALMVLIACGPPMSETSGGDSLVVAHAPLEPGAGVARELLKETEKQLQGALESVDGPEPAIELKKVRSDTRDSGGYADTAQAESAMRALPEAHLLLSGEVRASGEMTEVRLRLTTRADERKDGAGAGPSGLRMGFEETIELDPLPPSSLPGLSGLLRGLASVREKDWEAALEVFPKLESATFQAALAAALFTPETLSELNSAELSRATQYASHAFNSLSDTSPPRTESLLRLAYANATYVLGERLRGQACVAPLESAGLNFALYLESLPEDASREARAAGYRGLGDSLLRLGQRGEGAASTRYLTRAVRVYNLALRQLSREEAPAAWARVRFQRGLALYELGNRLPGPAGFRSLERSAQEFHGLLGYYTKESAPLSWASSQANLGQAEFAMGQKTAPAEAIQHYLYAATAYGQALEVYTKEEMRGAWARTNENLGLSYSALGAAMDGPEAIEHLLRGIDHLNRVDEVASLEEDPELWAMTRVYLAKTQLSLGQKVNPERAEEAHIQALRHCEAALKYFTREGHSRAWAVAQQTLGVASMRISQSSDERKARDRLDDAVAAFGAALEVRSLEETPEDWGISQWNLAHALILRSRLEEGEAAANYLRSAGRACREALRVFPPEEKLADYGRVQLTLAESLGGLAEVTPDESEAQSAADQAVWILIRTLSRLPENDPETEELQARLLTEFNHVQRLRRMVHAD